MKTDPEYKAEIARLLLVKGISLGKLRELTKIDVYRYMKQDVSMTVKNINVVFGCLYGLPDKE